MTLATKLAVTGVLCAIALGSVFMYFRINRSYYFPDQYEVGYGTMFLTMLGCLAALVLVTLHHAIIATRHETAQTLSLTGARESEPPNVGNVKH
jgi:hypothetical protein